LLQFEQSNRFLQVEDFVRHRAYYVPGDENSPYRRNAVTSLSRSR
jgi:hypothetical protein